MDEAKLNAVQKIDFPSFLAMNNSASKETANFYNCVKVYLCAVNLGRNARENNYFQPC